MKNKKLLIIVTSIIASLVVIVVCFYNFNLSFNESVNEALYNMSIDIDKTLNGYSIKEIEDKVKYSEIHLDDNLLYSYKDKYIINPSDEEQFKDIKQLEIHAGISYYLKDNSIKNIAVDKENMLVNIALLEPDKKLDLNLNNLNYLDVQNGLLSIRDLHLEQDDLNLLNQLVENMIKEKLDNDTNLEIAKNKELELFKNIYESLLKDIEGSSLFEIKVTFK